MDKLFILPHSHYDVEVFLTREEYLKIGYRVIIDALNMLNSDPDYKYILDQSAYIEPFLKAYPELKNTFINMIHDGRLELVGGMYVMSDLNLISGESIIRQFEIGKGFYKKELNMDVKTGWMIDTFGHCLQMPQIMRKCGFDTYIFSRVANLSKSEFYWQGIDGTCILTHWMPYHYGCFSNSPNWFKGFCDFVQQRYKMLKKFAATNAIAAPEGGDFTHPVRHDTEFARKWNSQPHRPFDLIIGTPKDFFNEVLKEKDKLDIVTDDFNPVFQGCYSARIGMKQQNRRLESLLYEAESFNALSLMLGGQDKSCYIRDAWELVLFNQFHDLIGGVQMDKVFENAWRRYVNAGNLIKLSLENSLNNIVEYIDTRGEGIPVVVFNALSWERTDKASVTVAYDTDDVFKVAVVDSNGEFIPLNTHVTEYYPNGAIRHADLNFIAKTPAMGYQVYRVLSNVDSPYKNPFNTGKWYGMEELNEGILENEYFKLKVDMWKGTITSIILKGTGEEYIDPEMPFGNMLVKEEDNGDFWEIGTPLRGAANRPITQIQPLNPDCTKTELSVYRGGSCSIIEDGISSTFIFTQKLSDYEFTTQVRLYTNLERIEIQSNLINRQKNVRYRIAFPTTIRDGDIIQEIPFGALKRNAGEYPAINWTDYSQSGRGLAVLNCGLPGNSVVDNKMMLSIMKCTSFVSYGEVGGFSLSDSSEGGHELNIPHNFKYALVPHKGRWQDALIHRQGAELNHPLTVIKAPLQSGTLSGKFSFVQIDNKQTIVSCVRTSGKGLMLRVYEATGKPAQDVRASFSNRPITVVETNMLEEPIEKYAPIVIDGKDIIFDLMPFEVRSFMVTMLT